MYQLTSDGSLVLAALLILILLVPLYISIKARTGDGVVELPSALISFLLFGFNGGAISTSVIIISNDVSNKKALIAHERVHQEQMKKVGLFTWYLAYIFNKKLRLDYEVEAYKKWIEVSPNDLSRCAFDLVNGYNFDLSEEEARKLLVH